MRVVIAEDQVLLREGLARLFADAGHEVLATLGDASSLAEVVVRDGPDLVVLDVRMPPTHTDASRPAAQPSTPASSPGSWPRPRAARSRLSPTASERYWS